MGDLADDIREFWRVESSDWDALVEGDGDAPPLLGDDDLWSDMPVVDSKAVARTSPIFKKHLGIPLDVKLIRPGGYSSIDEAIQDLEPKMRARAAEQSGARAKAKVTA